MAVGSRLLVKDLALPFEDRAAVPLSVAPACSMSKPRKLTGPQMDLGRTGQFLVKLVVGLLGGSGCLCSSPCGRDFSSSGSLLKYRSYL